MRRLLLNIILCCWASCMMGQERTVENRPYADLRPFHFGILVGTHLQDLELQNVGPTTYVNEAGEVVASEVLVDQDRWDPGFTVGVVGEFRINTSLQFRMAPAMYFGARHLSFRNLSQLDSEGRPLEERQDMKTAYFATAFDVIFAAQRFNNHRPYLMAGITPMLNLSGSNDDIIRLKSTDCYFEIGVGCDFYLPFFKLRPELKFMYSLTNSLDKHHVDHFRDKNKLPFAQAVDDTHSKMVALTFYFE